MSRCVLSHDSFQAALEHLSLAYIDYTQHPCLQNRVALMGCLDELVGHFQSLEGLKSADVIDPFLEKNLIL